MEELDSLLKIAVFEKSFVNFAEELKKKTYKDSVFKMGVSLVLAILCYLAYDSWIITGIALFAMLSAGVFYIAMERTITKMVEMNNAVIDSILDDCEKEGIPISTAWEILRDLALDHKMGEYAYQIMKDIEDGEITWTRS